jgi:hypothetical protein
LSCPHDAGKSRSQQGEPDGALRVATRRPEGKCVEMQENPANLCDMQQTPDQAAIAENLRALKGRRRVSDAEIADGTGLSRSAVNDRLTGRARIQVEDLGKFAAYFEVPLEQLLAPAPAGAAS